jgi:hypothetical protein
MNCQVRLGSLTLSNYKKPSSRRKSMNKKFIVKLTSQERIDLQELLNKGKAAANKLTHARILLKADTSEEGPNWTDAQIVTALEINSSTVQRTRQRFIEKGFEVSLAGERKPREFVPVLDGDAEAHLVALTCSTPPNGRKRWTVRLLASKMVELQYVERVGRETIRKALKKTNSSLG